jgi:hypothetical protein
MAKWIWPTQGTRINQGFMENGHHGLDIDLQNGDPIFAPTNSDVAFVGNPGERNGGYGGVVKLNTWDGYTVYLAHLKQTLIKQGEVARKGKLVGYGDNTGNSTGPHLHFEVRKGSGQVNPWNFYQGPPQLPPEDVPPAPPGVPPVDPITPLPGGSPGFPGFPGLPPLGITIPGFEEAGAALTAISDYITNFNWTRAFITLAGFGLVTVGVYGIVIKGAAGEVLKPVIGEIAKVIKER